MLQGGSLPNFQKVEFFAMPFGIIPSWEIGKREVVQYKYIRSIEPVAFSSIFHHPNFTLKIFFMSICELLILLHIVTYKKHSIQ